MSGSSHQSQFHLFRSRRFLPFFLTQFLGALNDNLFKNALLVLLVSAGIRTAGNNTDFLVNLAAGLFSLPFFLFSALAGQLADKYEKSAIVRHIKLAEILIMGLGVLALWAQNLTLLMMVLFAMGAQSTFFGPIKYSIIPQHLRDDELIAGNAQVEMGTFVAILIGTMGGSLLGDSQPVWLWAGLAVLLVAIFGWLGSLGIPNAPAPSPTLKINWNPLAESINLIKLAAEKRAVMLAILGISWYWFLGASYLTQIPNFAVAVLGGSPRLIAVLLATFTIGIGVGSLLCDRLSGQKVEIGLVPLGAIGLSLFGIDLFLAAEYFQEMNLGSLQVGQFLGQGKAVRILLDIVLIGVFGGFYIVPLYAMVQSRTRPEHRARVIAANNILNAIFLVLASLLGMLLLGWGGLTITRYWLVVALMNMAVALFIFLEVPEFTMRFLVWLAGHSLYRISDEGLDNIPEQGSAIIVCNHVSYIDALLLAGAIRRPIRFVMYKPIYDIPVLNFIFRTGRAIPICSRQEDETVYRQALDEAAKALEQGDLLCLFPEGQLTRTGEMNNFKPGIERILARTPVPVIPIALRGLWGSFFSQSGAGAFKTSPLARLRSKISVVAGEALAPQEGTVQNLYDQVAKLRGDNP